MVDIIRNDFHGTSVRVRSRARTLEILGRWTDLSPAERAHARRIRAKLCGIDGCTCGGVREDEQVTR
jgi:hypothetical protein